MDKLIRLPRDALLQLVSTWSDDVLNDEYRTLPRRAIVERIREEWPSLSPEQRAQVAIKTVDRHRYIASEATTQAFHPPLFVKLLKKLLAPLGSGDVYAQKHDTLPLVIVYIEFNGKSSFIAFPDPVCHVFHTALPRMVNECVELALSSSLTPTSLAGSLSSLLHMRATSRVATSLGGWNIYAYNKVDASPLEPVERSGIVKTRLSKSSDIDETDIDSRFGVVDGHVPVVLEKAEFRLTGDISTTVMFEGQHVFEGLYLLAKRGLIENIPAFITGELGVSFAVIES